MTMRGLAVDTLRSVATNNVLALSGTLTVPYSTGI